MNEQELSRRLREDMERRMPDMLQDIQHACETTPQQAAAAPASRSMPSLWRCLGAIAACLILFVGGLLTGRWWPEAPVAAPQAQTVLYVDVNPSVELRLDADGRVLSCVAGNDDAQALLSELSLVGVQRDTALTALMGAMYLHGYIDRDNNAILVSVAGTEDGDVTAHMLQQISDKIHAAFEHSAISCAVIAQPVTNSETLTQLAQTYGISVGKMHLIEKLIEGLASFDLADLPTLVDLSVAELQLMYSHAVTDGEHFSEDIVSGLLGGFVGREDALASLLDAIGEPYSFIEAYETEIDHVLFEDVWHTVYRITVQFKLSSNTYSFAIDCKTGEILESDFELG